METSPARLKARCDVCRYSPGYSLWCAVARNPGRFGVCPLRSRTRRPDFVAVTAAISPASTWFVRSRPQSSGMHLWLETSRWMSRQCRRRSLNRFGAGGAHHRIESRSCRGQNSGDQPKKPRATAGCSRRFGGLSDPRPSLTPWLLIAARVSRPRRPARIAWSVCSWGLQTPKQSPWPWTASTPGPLKCWRIAAWSRPCASRPAEPFSRPGKGLRDAFGTCPRSFWDTGGALRHHSVTLGNP